MKMGFSVGSVLRLHSEGQWEKSVGIQSAVSSRELRVSIGNSQLAVRNLRC